MTEVSHTLPLTPLTTPGKEEESTNLPLTSTGEEEELGTQDTLCFT